MMRESKKSIKFKFKIGSQVSEILMMMMMMMMMMMTWTLVRPWKVLGEKKLELCR
jgi:hypothetical protein